MSIGASSGTSSYPRSFIIDYKTLIEYYGQPQYDNRSTSQHTYLEWNLEYGICFMTNYAKEDPRAIKLMEQGDIELVIYTARMDYSIYEQNGGINWVRETYVKPMYKNKSAQELIKYVNLL